MSCLDIEVVREIKNEKFIFIVGKIRTGKSTLAHSIATSNGNKTYVYSNDPYWKDKGVESFKLNDKYEELFNNDKPCTFIVDDNWVVPVSFIKALQYTPHTLIVVRQGLRGLHSTITYANVVFVTNITSKSEIDELYSNFMDTTNISKSVFNVVLSSVATQPGSAFLIDNNPYKENKLYNYQF
jgi:AAA+ ATPase superfamily predicted ATPase